MAHCAKYNIFLMLTELWKIIWINYFFWFFNGNFPNYILHYPPLNGMSLYCKVLQSANILKIEYSWMICCNSFYGYTFVKRQYYFYRVAHHISTTMLKIIFLGCCLHSLCVGLIWFFVKLILLKQIGGCQHTDSHLLVW